MFEHRVKDNEKLAHAGGQSDLWSFSGRAKTLVEGFEDRIAAHSDNGAHVQRRTNVAAAAGDRALALPGSAFSIERCNTDQCGDLAAVELTEFRQTGKERDGRNWSHAWHRTQQFRFAAPNLRRSNELADLFINRSELLAERLEVGSNPSPHGFGRKSSRLDSAVIISTNWR